jgi:hypothetical protein
VLLGKLSGRAPKEWASGPFFDAFATNPSGYTQAIRLSSRGTYLDVSEHHRQEQRTQEAIKVRQVSEVHANFNEQERGEPGKFSLQFVLDNGADEYVLRPTAEDARTLMLMIDEAESMYFDTERRVLILRDLD